MPELPEVETVKNGLIPVFDGRVIKKVTLNRSGLRYPFPDNMSELLVEQRCTGLRRRGKYIWMDIENGQTLVIHLGMSGSFAINSSSISKHDHVVFENDKDDVIVYNDPRRFGMMYFVETGKETLHPSFEKMGPEPLGNNFNAEYLMNALKTRKTPIKTALLDQSIVAGIGNIYACEALYMSAIHPLCPSNEISINHLEGLVQAIRDVLDAAIASGGSTLRDHRQADGKMGYFQHNFKVYDRAGEKCSETGGEIVKIVQSGRSTYFCPERQKIQGIEI